MRDMDDSDYDGEVEVDGSGEYELVDDGSEAEDGD